METQFTFIKKNSIKSILTCFILLFLCFEGISQTASSVNERTVTGIINSDSGPVFGVTVLLKGTFIGTHTDEEGKFTFPKKLKTGDVLLCTSLGFEDLEVPIEADTTFITPFLEGIEVVIRGDLRTNASKSTHKSDED